jgi:hypothetical protein
VIFSLSFFISHSCIYQVLLGLAAVSKDAYSRLARQYNFSFHYGPSFALHFSPVHTANHLIRHYSRKPLAIIILSFNLVKRRWRGIRGLRYGEGSKEGGRRTTTTGGEIQ